MYPFVTLKITDLGEAVATRGTYIRSPTQMDAVMVDQTRMIKERLWAVGALMGWLFGVCFGAVETNSLRIEELLCAAAACKESWRK